jgi:hypothetical protein
MKKTWKDRVAKSALLAILATASLPSAGRDFWITGHGLVSGPLATGMGRLGVSYHQINRL